MWGTVSCGCWNRKPSGENLLAAPPFPVYKARPDGVAFARTPMEDGLRMQQLPGRLNVAGPALVALALLLLGGAAWVLQYERARLPTWPATEAEVIRSYVVTRRRPGDPRTLYVAQHELRFTLGDREYVTVAESGEPSPQYAGVQARVDEFHSGSRRLVHYNPQNPAEVHIQLASAMRPFVGPLLLGGVGSGCLLFGVALSWGMLQRGFGAAVARVRLLRNGARGVPETRQKQL